MAELIPRHARTMIEEALADTRVVLLLGARQVGKSTLATEIAAYLGAAGPITLDDATTRAAVDADPSGFVASLQRPVVLDEVQRSEQLLLAIKEAVDKDTSPGQFLLTGSANILTAPKIHDALTGRTEIVGLWPFSQSEIERSGANLVDRLFKGSAPPITGAAVGRDAFVERAIRGGYPEAYGRPQRRRERWFESYIESVITRDIRDLADVRRVDAIPSLLRLIAAQAANLFKAETMSNDLNISTKTVQSYTELLETVYLVRRIKAWRAKIGKREVTTPKIYVVDSGLLAYLVGADQRRAAKDDQVAGKLFENFVAMEIVRLLDWAETSAAQYHYRDRSSGDEIDIVLESRAGEIVCLECKAAATVRHEDYRAIAKLRDARGEQFVAGVVVYTGTETKALTEKIWAVPVSALWGVADPSARRS
ncbi:MAG: ATP-binding protein [Thermoleophilia bacterium]|nr:ATP-binding protein [Thermoleophilia bacterium]